MMIRTSLRSFVNTLYPPLCKACGTQLLKGEEILCLACEYTLPTTNYHLEQDNLLWKKFYAKLEVQQALSLYYFHRGGAVQHLIHELKYQGKYQVGVYLGKKYGKVLLQQAQIDFDLILPIPLHSRKQRTRGYNQAEAFAIGLSEELGIAYSNDYLIRTLHTQTQTKMSRYVRYLNMEQAFSLKNADALKGLHILLVDDVITSGATMITCGRLFRNIEGIRLSVASIACRID